MNLSNLLKFLDRPCSSPRVLEFFFVYPTCEYALVDTFWSTIDRVQSNGQYTGLVKGACMTVALDDQWITIRQHTQAQVTRERISSQDSNDANSTFRTCTKATPRFETLAQCGGPPVPIPNLVSKPTTGRL